MKRVIDCEGLRTLIFAVGYFLTVVWVGDLKYLYLFTFVICRAFNPWCEISLLICSAIAGLRQNQDACTAGMENLKLGNPSQLMTSQNHTRRMKLLLLCQLEKQSL